MNERCGRYEIVGAAAVVVPADSLAKEWDVDTVWGRRWTLYDEGGTLHTITFGALLDFHDALDRGEVSDEVRRVFETEGRSKIEDDYCEREPSALPTRVELTPTGLREDP